MENTNTTMTGAELSGKIGMAKAISAVKAAGGTIDLFAYGRERGLLIDRSKDNAPRGKGNAVSRRLGYTLREFRCYCEWSPCQHEPMQGSYSYENRTGTDDWQLCVKLPQSNRALRYGGDVVTTYNRYKG